MLRLRWAVAVWVVIVAAVGVRVLLKPHSNTVFPIFADAGRNWLAGVDLYGAPKPDLDQFRYLPAIAAAFAILIPLAAGAWIWRIAIAQALSVTDLPDPSAKATTLASATAESPVRPVNRGNSS